MHRPYWRKLLCSASKTASNFFFKIFFFLFGIQPGEVKHGCSPPRSLLICSVPSSRLHHQSGRRLAVMGWTKQRSTCGIKETLLYLYFLYKKDREEEGAAVSLNSAPQMGKFGEMLKFVFILWRKLVTDSRASVFIIFLLLFSCPRVRTRVGINTPQVNYLLIMSVMKYTSDFFPPLPNI